MNNPLDKLFKDKLGDHTLPPPSQAWVRIEANLSKKNNGLLRFRIAAVLLLLSAMAATLVWLAEDKTSTPAGLATNTPAKEQARIKEVSPPKIDNRQIAQLPAAPKKKKAIISAKTTEQEITPTDVTPPVALVELPSENQSLTAISESPIVPVEEEKLVAVQETIEKPIIIEYRLKTITTQPTPSEVTASAKERSGFRKVLDFALDAKNSSPLGDLREQKDKLFAFNKKEKQIVK